MAQRTFSIVKPDAVRNGHTGAILAEIDPAGRMASDLARRLKIKAAQP